MDRVIVIKPTTGDTEVEGALKLNAALVKILAAYNLLVAAETGTTQPGPNVPPTASITVVSITDLTVVLKATVGDTDGTVTTISWGFSDGNTDSGTTVTHAFANAGTYAITLTVADDDGATTTVMKNVTVKTSTTAEFTIGVVQPTAANTGAGRIRAYPTGSAGTKTGTQTLTGSTVLQGWTINGSVNISGTAKLLDCIVNGTVSCSGGTPLVENNVIQGDGTTTYVGSDGKGQSKWLVNTSASTRASIRFNTIRGRVLTNGLNGIGLRNMLAEYNDISRVVDGFDIDGATIGSNGVDANTTARGNYVHDLIFYSPDPGHSPVTNTTVTGTSLKYTGQWLNGAGQIQPSTHCDGFQLTGNAKNVLIQGNTVDARWANDIKSGTLPIVNGTIFYYQLSALMLNGCTGLKVWDNWFRGGQFTCNLATTTAGQGGDFRRNRFDRTMAPYGLSTTEPFTIYSNGGATWTTHDGTADQNVYSDTGNPILVRGSHS